MRHDVWYNAEHKAEPRILAVDVGTGTWDILLFDSIAHAGKLSPAVMPSPRCCCQRNPAELTKGDSPLLTSVTMGAGPAVWST